MDCGSFSPTHFLATNIGWSIPGSRAFCPTVNCHNPDVCREEMRRGERTGYHGRTGLVRHCVHFSQLLKEVADDRDHPALMCTRIHTHDLAKSMVNPIPFQSWLITAGMGSIRCRICTKARLEPPGTIPLGTLFAIQSPQGGS
jgi:hypothetical protein